MTTSHRTAIIAGNWKMYNGPKKAASFAHEIVPELARLVEQQAHVLCILCPPTISLSSVRAVLDATPHPHIELGAQNMYFQEQGAFTGETSPTMVRELCSSVILGHSERRTYFGETDELVNQKALAALHHNLRPIICIGENEEQHDANQAEQVIRAQVQLSLAHFSEHQARQVVIAYEPIWAIGTGKAATAEGAGKIISLIRQLYGEMYGSESASALRILYGGSVTSANISEFMAHSDIDGALVGGASLKPDFVAIVHNTIRARQHQ